MSNRVLALCLAAFLLPACGDSHESAMDDSLDLMEEMADIVEDIKTSDDAKAAAEKLRELGEEYQELAKRMQELGDPTKEQRAELDEKYGPRAKEIQQRLMAAMMNLQQKYPEAAQALGAAMQKMR